MIAVPFLRLLLVSLVVLNTLGKELQVCSSLPCASVKGPFLAASLEPLFLQREEK